MKTPVFSIVVPTFRRPGALATLLKGIAAINFPKNQLEVIVVDDSGCGDPEPVLAPFRDCFALIALHTPHLGPGPARQAGIDLAQGEYLAFTDDDCIPDPDWLRELQFALEANPECAVAGALLNGLPENLFSSVSQRMFDYLVHNTGGHEVEFVGTGNVAYPAAAFHAIGGMDRDWPIWGGEDRDLCCRWRGSGRRFIVHPPAVIRHYHPLTLRRFWNQHFRYGRGACRFHRTHRLQSAGFYWRLLAAGFCADGRHSGLLTGMLTLVSQVATGCGFLVERFLRPSS